MFFTAKRNVDGVGLRVYFAAKLRGMTRSLSRFPCLWNSSFLHCHNYILLSGTVVLIELTLSGQAANNRGAAKSASKELAVAALQAVVNLVARQ